jgi:hypothetical protein
VAKEQEVVLNLRNVVGYLSDLTEQFGFKAPPKSEIEPKKEEVAKEDTGGGGAAPSAPSETPREEAASSKGDCKEEIKEETKPEEEAVKKESENAEVGGKAEKKKKEQRKERRKNKALSGGGDTPKGKREREDRREVDRAGVSERKERKTGRRAEDEGVRLQAVVDRYVSSHPSSFGLESIPVRGSAGRHIVERETRGRERPPEPQGAPPRRSQPRDRSRSKKKSKGAKHRERGRQFWRSYRQGEQWRRS